MEDASSMFGKIFEYMLEAVGETVDEEVQTPLCGQTVYSAGPAKH